jgi:hypothetical protein
MWYFQSFTVNQETGDRALALPKKCGDTVTEMDDVESLRCKAQYAQCWYLAVGKAVLRGRTRGKPTSIFNHIIYVDTQYSPSMSYLEPSTSSLQSKEIIGRGTMSSRSQRQR